MDTLLLAAALAALLAGAVAAVSGFGIGSLLTPVLLPSFPASRAIALVSIPHAVASIVRLLRLRRHIHWPTLRQFGVASAAGGLVGALLATRLGNDPLATALGALLIMAGTAEISGRRLPLPNAPVWRLLGGVLSGFFGGLVGNQGGIRAAALLGFRLSREQLVATSTASAVLVDVARVPIYLAAWPAMPRSEPVLLLVMVAFVIAGTLVGVPVLGRIPDAVYQRVIGLLLVLLGAGLILVTMLGN